MAQAGAKAYQFETEKPLGDGSIISFLTGDAGKVIFAEYQGRASKDFGDADALNALDYNNGVIRGSNPFAVALIGQIVRDSGLHVATPADIEKSLRAGDILGIRGNHYVDTGLVLRSEEEPNSYLAQNLAEQLRARGTVEYPVMVPLSGVELVRDSGSSCGLAFKLRDDAEVVPAPVLNKDSNFTTDVDQKTGLPTETCSEGNRIFYTRTSGLSRLNVDDVLSLDAYSNDLNNSYPGGRVAVVREGAAVPYTSSIPYVKIGFLESLLIRVLFRII
ncbi:hypothetical protein HY497_02330 [Candidatus Woesearchaeota archaeon]|nr:hypothetical protein [Candidatus Woesearchaeota archaeon]